MNKRLYVDFHILQTVPPSCINRDDTGSPKTAVYGGVLRARVSSQAWKHAMRAAFAENAQLDVGKRTKKAAELVKAQILALAPELDAADKLAKKALENAGIKFDEKSKKDDTVTKALFFMSTAQAKALAELAVEVGLAYGHGFHESTVYIAVLQFEPGSHKRVEHVACAVGEK